MNGNIELISLFWTCSGVFWEDGEISPFNFKDRVEAASNAGFKGIGIWHTDLEYSLTKYSLKEMRHILDDYGMKYLELEFLNDWFVEGVERTKSDRIRDLLFSASSELNASHIKVGDLNSREYNINKVIDEFALLCNQAENYGATIGFEVMQCSMIKSLKEAMHMIESAAPKNGGIIIDIVQQMRLGMTFDEICKIPLKYLVSIELNDGVMPWKPEHSSVGRLYCGEGEFDIKGFIKCAIGMGYEGPWAVEVFNRKYLNQSLAKLNERAYKTTIAQFDA